MMRWTSIAVIAFAVLGTGMGWANPSADLIVVVGAPGTEEFGKAFESAAEAWEKAGEQGGASVTLIGREDHGTLDLKILEKSIADSGAEGPLPLWIVLLGHGTFDGREAKFNLRGKDLSAVQLAEWLSEFKRPVAIINSSASSAPFIKKLTKPGRVVMTATKSGSEDSYARFGEHLANAINAPEADLDRDGATSLLEAFLAASKGVEEFYEKEGRIATEQAIIDDNGDGFGTPAAWFRGVRAVKKAKDDAKPDGLRAHQFHLVPSAADLELSPGVRERRDALEAELFALRARKDSMDEDAYFLALERIALQLAALYHQETEDSPDPDS
jgi:hypothetical protein